MYCFFITGLIYEETRGVLKVFLENVIRDAVTYCEHGQFQIFSIHLSRMLYFTIFQQNERPSPLWMSSMPSNAKAALFTVSVAKSKGSSEADRNNLSQTALFRATNRQTRKYD